MKHERFAVMAVDPGGTTGCARGVFDVRVDGSVKGVLDAGVEWESWEVEGQPAEQAYEIWDEWLDWSAGCQIDGVPIPSTFLVMEDFILRPSKATPQRNLLAPVEILAGIRALSVGVADVGMRYELVPAGTHKGYATDARIKDWGLWVRGSPHKRDANRLMAYTVGKVVHGGW